MKLSNNQKVYVKILSYIPGDPLAPYIDGSRFSRQDRAYKETIKINNKNYKYLKAFIGTEDLLEVYNITFAQRDGSCLDELKTHQITVFDKPGNIYTFNIGESGDGSSLTKDLYEVEFIIK